jgi:hypothetical protein
MTPMQFFESVAGVITALVLIAFLKLAWEMGRDFLTSKMETEKLINSFDRVCSKFESLEVRISKCEAALNTKPIGTKE